MHSDVFNNKQHGLPTAFAKLEQWETNKGNYVADRWDDLVEMTTETRGGSQCVYSLSDKYTKDKQRWISERDWWIID